MSMGPVDGVLGSAPGAPLSQTKGPAVERAVQDAAAKLRQPAGDRHAAGANGIAETDVQQNHVSDRDADGRLPWQHPPQPDAETTVPTSAESPVPSRDATGCRGTRLDLTG